MAALWLGCGASKTKLTAVEPAPSLDAVAQFEAGASVAVQRPTPGAVKLSLWIAAGARDASPPQLALAAALWAGMKRGLTPRVLAEGTEFSLLCAAGREALEACAARLLGALDPAPPRADDAVRAREQLRSARAQASADASRQAEQLALTALLGDEARQLFPLGVEADDARVSAEAMRGFIERNYAASRALLLGLGDLTKAQLAPLAQRMKARASAQRAAPVALHPREDLRVDAADSGHIALTLTSASVARAASVCQRFRAIHGDARAHISSLRGLTLAHLWLPAGELPFARLQSAVFDLRRILLETSSEAPAPPPDTLDALSQNLGEAWVGRAPGTPAAAEGTLGVALLWPRQEKSADNATDALDKIRERARAAIDAGTRNATLRLSISGSGPLQRAKLANGARLEFVRRPGERWFAAALRFAAGSATDAATGHGRAALLASLMADGCGVASGRTLDLQLSSLQARLFPLVDAAGLGVGVSAPSERSEEALDLLLRCALRPAVQARAVEDARARLLRRLYRDQALELAARLGQLLAPAAPGTLAPWGTPVGIAKVELGELRRLHTQLTRGPLISLWATGDRATPELLTFAARRLAYLSESGTEPAALEPGTGAEIGAAQVEDARLRVLVGVSATRDRAAQLGAQVFARALARALETRVGEANWATGTVHAARAFAGVALSVREEQLEALNREVDAALRELRDKPDAFYRATLDEARLTQSATLSSARGWVEAAFAGDADAAYTPERELGLVRALTKATPSYLVLRPRP